MKKLCKNPLSTVKSLANIEKFMTQGAVFFSPTENRFFCVRNCVPVKGSSERFNGGSSCSALLCPFWLVRMNDSFQADPKYSIAANQYVSFPNCLFSYSTFQPNITVLLFEETYTRTRMHTRTHTSCISQHRWWATWVRINEVTDTS